MDPTHALNAPETPPPPSPSDPRYPAGSQAPATPPPATAVHHSLVAATGEQCPSCGHPVASDQRYCLSCGQRCGDPRLPFMNAVTFMDSMKRPAAASPPPPKQRRLSPNAALIASVGTLLLAMGVGVLIGRSGGHSASTASEPTRVITVNAGGNAESATATGSEATKGGTKSGKPNKKAAAKAKEKAESGAAAEEVLKPSGNVDLPPATVQPGGKCEGERAGCENGEFTGEFFGE